MPQTPRKKNRAKNWLNGVLRETLADTEPEEDRIYPKLPSDESESDSEMENIGATGGNPQVEDNAYLLQEVRLLKLQMQSMQDKERSKDFTQTEENNVTLDIYNPIKRVRNMLEKPKRDDYNMEYIQLLKDKIAAGKADQSTYDELSEAESLFKRRILDFVEGAPQYDGKSEEIHIWCWRLERYLRRHECETIPNEAVKQMLLRCIPGYPKQEIMLLQPSGLDFENCETGEFFTEFLKQLSQEKDEEDWKQEYFARKQERNEDPRKYYTDKLRLWEQAYAPAQRSLNEFKNAMLMGLYNAELRKTCLNFMPKELKQENEIKAVLDQQLVNFRKYNMYSRVPSQDMAWIRKVGSFETMGNNTRSEEMMKTGKMKRKPVSFADSGTEGHISKDYRNERRNSGRRDEQQNVGGGKMAEMVKFMMNIEDEADKWQKWCAQLNSKKGEIQPNKGGGHRAEMAELVTDNKQVTKTIEKATEALKKNSVNFEKNSYSKLENNSESFNVQSFNPELTENWRPQDEVGEKVMNLVKINAVSSKVRKGIEGKMLEKETMISEDEKTMEQEEKKARCSALKKTMMKEEKKAVLKDEEKAMKEEEEEEEEKKKKKK